MSPIARLMCALILLLAASAAHAQIKVPSEQSLEALVKVSLLSFNDANVTGNYEVFRAKTSKPFRDKFSAEQLEKRFHDFSSKHVDFDIIAAMKPTYDPQPSIDDKGVLLVKGWFPTKPKRVSFTLDFIPSDGEWKLIGINVKIDSPPPSDK